MNHAKASLSHVISVLTRTQAHSLFFTRANSRADVNATLDRVATGAETTVEGIDSNLDPAIHRRLLDLGFTPGSHIEVLRAAPLGDPRIYRLAGYEVALRAQQARHIIVREDS